MMSPPHFSDSIDQLVKKFERAKGDYAQLKLIADALQHHSATKARILRLKVINEMSKIKKQSELTYRTAPSTPLLELLARVGLDAPDGRPLHRYRLGADGYDQLTALLRQHAALLKKGDKFYAAPLVLWASAWFRREYGGGVRRYCELGAGVGASLDEHEWPPLIESGLIWWKRPVIRRASGRQWLLTLAVEGGFPVRVLQAGEGWLPRYLNEVVGRLLGLAENISLDDAISIADAAKEELRDTYRQEHFIALAADLALAIVKLRGLAEAAAPNLTPSAVLDQIHPRWRDELPIAADTAAARALVDGMLAAKKIALGLSGDAGCVRVLRRGVSGWRSGIRLSLRGAFHQDVLQGLAEPGIRLRVSPHGVLARALGEDLAILDPPGENDQSWLLRPLTRKTELDDVPLPERIDVMIQSPKGASRIAPWPGGEAERNDVLTFEIDAEDTDGPKSLVLAACGSARLRAQQVVVAAPAEWSVYWEDNAIEGAPKRIGATDDGRSLWIADKSVLVKCINDNFIYRIQPGADAESRDRIMLEGRAPQSFDSADDVPLFAGAPTIHFRRGQTTIDPDESELFWRHAPSEPWRPLQKRRSLPVGVIDILWRDARTKFIYDRVRVAITPQSAYVIRERVGDGHRYSFQEFGDLTISPEPAPGLYVERVSNCVFTLSFRSNPMRRITFALRSQNSARAIRITLPFPLRDGLAHWNGKIIPPGSDITPTELADLVAFGAWRFRLCCELKDAECAFPAYYTLGEQELGLRPLADRIRSDLAGAGIDAWIALSIGDGAPPWRIRLFDSKIRYTDGQASIVKLGSTEAALTLNGRSVEFLYDEKCLAQFDHKVASISPTATLPECMTGAWLVYLRSGRAVKSRPSIVYCSEQTQSAGDDFAATLVIADKNARKRAIRERLNAITVDADGAAADIAWLKKLIGSLDGLPASTFDVLAALPDAPTVLARLLLSADEDAQGSIWRLETELTFLWAALPLEAWRAAADAVGKSVVQPLVDVGWALARAVPMGRQVMNDASARTGHLDPVIEAALTAAGLRPRPADIPTIDSAAQGYVRRTFDSGDKTAGPTSQTSLFRQTRELDQHLPQFFKMKFDLAHLESLDAPIAAAVAARTDVKLTPTQIRRCKEAMRADPVYFSEGFTAALLSALK